MAETGTGLLNGVFQVAEAGKRKHLPSIAELSGGAYASCKSVTVQAPSTNEGTIVVGGIGVVAATGNHAGPTQVGIALKAGEKETFLINDTAEIYIDVIKAADAVSFVVLAA